MYEATSGYRLDELPVQGFEPSVMAGMTAPARTLLLVIDIQEDFAAPEGAMARYGLDLSFAAAAIPRIESLIAAAREAGVAVGFARVVTRPETDSTALRHFMQRTGQGSGAMAICRDGTTGCAFHALHPRDGDLVVSKTLFSCFAGTDFEAELRARGVDTLVVTGMTTECCVDCTVRDGFHRNFDMFVVVDACAAYDERTHLAALDGLGRNCAVLVRSDTVLEGWSAITTSGTATPSLVLTK